MFPDDSWEVEHHGLDEEEENDPLIIFVIGHFFSFRRSQTWMGLVLTNILGIANTICITRYTRSKTNMIE